MKVSIRRGVFETNSSGTHSLVIFEGAEAIKQFKAWRKMGSKLRLDDEKILGKGYFVTDDDIAEYVKKQYAKDRLELAPNELLECDAMSEEELIESYIEDLGYQIITWDEMCEIENGYHIEEYEHKTRAGEDMIVFCFYTTH